MFLLGHLGIGRALVSRLRPALPARAVLLGAILPDLIDKPLYYGLTLATGHQGAALGLICGTRTFGHSGLLLMGLALVLAAAVRARRVGVATAQALVLGVITHWLLDFVGDLGGRMATLDAIFYPLLGGFYPLPPGSLVDHLLRSFGRAYVVAGEVLGAILLARSRKRYQCVAGGDDPSVG